MYLYQIMILMKYYSIKASCSNVHRCHDYKRFVRGGLMHFYVFTLWPRNNYLHKNNCYYVQQRRSLKRQI